MSTGRVVGNRYEVVQVYLADGDVEVAVARDRDLGMDVVLQSRAVDGDAQLADFRRRAAALMRIPPHPGVPVVRSDFVADGRYVLVCDHIDGEDLSSSVGARGAGLALAEVLAVVDTVATALDHLHAQRPPVVHGGVEPAHLIRAADGRVVLVDFGGALRAPGAGAATAPAYAAPEIVAGELPAPAADLYALAATTAFLLTGVAPQVGAPWGAVLTSAGLGRLERVIRGGLTWDPIGRPRTAGEFAARLRDAAAMDVPTGTVTSVLFGTGGSAAVLAAATAVVRDAGGHLVDAVSTPEGTALAVFSAARAAVDAAFDVEQLSGAGTAVHAGDLGGWHGATVQQLANDAVALRAGTGAGVVCSPPVRMLLGSDDRFHFDRVGNGFAVRLAAAAQPAATVAGDRSADRASNWVAARRSVPIVGREAELRLAQHVIEQGRAMGRSAVLVVVGEAGMGKSRLLAEVAHGAAERGDRVLVGRCTESGGAFEPLLDALGDDALTLPGGQVERDEEGWVDRRRFFRSISDALRTAAPRHVLVLDDVQWIDGSSLALLQHLVDELHGSFSVVAGRRHTAAAPLIEQLTGATRIEVGPLSAAHLAELAERSEVRLDDAALRSLHSLSGGSPFFTLQLLQRIAVDDNPLVDERRLTAGVRDWILQRVDALGSAVRETLVPAGVIGGRFEVVTLADVIGVSPLEALSHLDLATGAGLVMEGEHPGEYRFVHAIVSTSLAESLSATRRALLHGVIAERLERSSDAAEQREAALHHWFEAERMGNPLHAADLAAELADQATERLAHERARTILDRALEVLETAPPGAERDRAESRLRVAQGRAAFLASDLDVAMEQVFLAADLAERGNDGQALAEAALVASLSRRHGRDDPELLRLLERAIDRCPAEPAVLAAMLHVRRARLLPATVEHHERCRMARKALAFVDRMSRVDRATVETEVARACWGPDDAAEREAITSRHIAEAERELEHGQASRWTGVMIEALNHRSGARVQLGHLRAALADADRAAQLAYEAGSTFLMTRVMMGQAMIHTTLGNDELAERLAADAVAQSDRHNLVLVQMTISYAIRRDRGEQAELARLESALGSLVDRIPLFMSAFALVHAEAGQLDDARRLLAELQTMTPWPRNWLWLAGNVASLEAAVLAGVEPLITNYAAVLRRYSGQWALGGAELLCFGPVDRVLGLAAAAKGDTDEARRLLTAARRVAEAEGAAPWVRRCDEALATLEGGAG